MLSAIRGEEQSSGFADHPAHLIRGSRTRRQIGGHSALLQFPGPATIGAAFDLASITKTPGLLLAWGDNVSTTGDGEFHKIGRITAFHGYHFC